MATDVVAAELARIETRLPDLTADELAEVRKALHRVAEKLIHAPRSASSSSSTAGPTLTYAEALADCSHSTRPPSRP